MTMMVHMRAEIITRVTIPPLLLATTTTTTTTGAAATVAAGTTCNTRVLRFELGARVLILYYIGALIIRMGFLGYLIP